MSPKRSRSHVLETASERSFLRALPETWTESRPGADYGVDLRVEVFTAPNDSGTCFPTGEEFGVQLKATDDEESTAMSVGVRWETYEYWRSLLYPVLVVRYLAASDQLFAMWAHDRGSHSDDAHLKAAWFRFGDEHAIGESFEHDVRSEILSFRSSVLRQVEFPLDIFVSGSPSKEWLLRMNAGIAGLLGDDVLRLRSGESTPSLRFLRDRVAFSFGAGVGVVVHAVVEPANVAACDVALLAGICLARVGCGPQAELCVEASVDSVLMRNPSLRWMASCALISCGRLRSALSLARRHVRTDPAGAQYILAVSRLAGLRDNSAAMTEARELGTDFVSFAENEAERATALYNYANLLRSFSDHDGAVRALRACADLETGYSERQYFWADLGGSLFLTGKWAEAAYAYEIARGLGDERVELRQRRLDAIFEAGRYSDVASEVSELLEPTSDEILLGLSASAIAELFGIERQDRNPEGLRLFAEKNPDAPVEDFARFDATDPGVWRQIVLDRRHTLRDSQLAIALIAVARLSVNEYHAWAAAIVCSYGAGAPNDLRRALLDRAFFFCGQSVASHVADAADAMALRDVDPAVAEQLFEDLGSVEASPRDGFSIRDARTGEATMVVERGAIHES